jgi:predicted tellurium resistance membrane protein TerC
MELLSDPQSWIAFLTLTALELVLGIDNIIFISVLVDKLPEARRPAGRAARSLHALKQALRPPACI